MAAASISAADKADHSWKTLTDKVAEALANAQKNNVSDKIELFQRITKSLEDKRAVARLGIGKDGHLLELPSRPRKRGNNDMS